jgi:hypothetical protein
VQESAIKELCVPHAPCYIERAGFSSTNQRSLLRRLQAAPTMPTGTVKWFNDSKEAQKVSFDAVDGAKGPAATNIRTI